MKMKDKYQKYLKARESYLVNNLSHFWHDQESRYVEPFKIFGNVYYVGDSWVCVHLIDTGDGLLLIDGGNCGGEAMLIHAIWSLGFNPADVKWMILSHGHVDHFGAANFMRRMFGTKLYLGDPDAKMFSETPELSMIQESPDIMDELFIPDFTINDGDLLTFGDVEMQFYLVPGHTMGCIAIFFDVTEGTTTKRAGYYGGFGFNTLQTDYLLEIGDSTFQNRRIYLDSLAKVRSERVELFLGNHTANNNLLNNIEKMKANPDNNPFIDSTSWQKYLDQKRDELLELIALECENPYQ